MGQGQTEVRIAGQGQTEAKIKGQGQTEARIKGQGQTEALINTKLRMLFRSIPGHFHPGCYLDSFMAISSDPLGNSIFVCDSGCYWDRVHVIGSGK